MKKTPKHSIHYQAPFYLQLKEVLLGKIREGEYPPGTPIPSENDLAQTYGLTRMTVRSAVDILVREGLLKRIHGKGIFVMGDILEKELNGSSGFRQTLLQKKSAVTVRVQQRYNREAGPKYSALFHIGEKDPIYYVRKIFFNHKEPVCVEDLYLPSYLLQPMEHIDFAVFSTDELFEFYGVEVEDLYQTLSLTQVSGQLANFLHLEENHPVLYFESWKYNAKGHTIEYARNYTRGDQCAFQVHFSREVP